MSQHKVWTRSKILFDLVEPDPDEVVLSDIVFPLSSKRRYSDQTTLPLTVAAHSVILSRFVPPHLKAAAVLHDAAEAYTGDIIAPIKKLFPDFAMHLKTLELGVLTAIEQAFEVPFVEHLPDLDRWDKALADIEMNFFYGRAIHHSLVEWASALREIQRFTQMSVDSIAFEFMLSICEISSITRSQIADLVKPSEN